MNSAMIKRNNYLAEYLAFIPTTDTDWRVQFEPKIYLRDEQGEIIYDENRNPTLLDTFTVGLLSEQDTTETLDAFLANHAALTVIASKAEIQADGIDSVTWSIAGQTAFSYRLMQGNIEAATGSVNDGSLTFKTDEPDTYSIELKVGQQTGYSQVKAVN